MLFQKISKIYSMICTTVLCIYIHILYIHTNLAHILHSLLNDLCAPLLFLGRIVSAPPSVRWTFRRWTFGRRDYLAPELFFQIRFSVATLFRFFSLDSKNLFEFDFSVLFSRYRCAVFFNYFVCFQPLYFERYILLIGIHDISFESLGVEL